VKAADSSVAVAAFASWHEHHAVARAALEPGTRLVGHSAVETYSVLTRLPPPHRAPANIVREFLLERFTADYLVLDPASLKAWLAGLPEMGVSGGATYDALIGATAAAGGATLLTLDVRAASTYEKCGADFTLLAYQQAIEAVESMRAPTAQGNPGRERWVIERPFGR
jgi:predicted nucleic acid-binding protein